MNSFFCLVTFRTWKNTQLGDEMIRTLENQGLEMAIEKQNYIGEK